MLAWQAKLTKKERIAWRQKMSAVQKRVWASRRTPKVTANGNGHKYGRGNTTRLLLAVRKLDADIQALQLQRTALAKANDLAASVLNR